MTADGPTTGRWREIVGQLESKRDALSIATILPMHVVVLGAGAIGTFYGARLSAANDVTLVARAEHVERIRSQGVRVTGLEDAIYRVNASTELRAIGRDTVILLTTKVTDSEQAVRPIADLVAADTTIVCLQNGLRSEEIVTAIVGGRCLVVRGITHFGATFSGPGVVALKADGHTLLAPSARSGSIADVLTACRLDGRVSDRMKDEIWRKLIFNCVVNPLTAMTRMEVGWIADERLNPLKLAIIDECVQVARKDGVVFDLDFVQIVNDTFRPSRNHSSMHQDLVRGKRTEIDYLNGAVVALGKRYGIDCPVNESLVAMIKALEART
jgi:2-dehydropantoate 2-reductase